MLRPLVGGTVAVALAGLVGYVVGERQGFIMGMRHLETEVAAALSGDVEVASCARTGDTKRALQILDLRIDGGVLRLSSAKHNLGFLAAQAQERPEEALGLAKAYRGVVPSAGRDAAAVASALERVSPSKGATPALSALVKGAGE